jgi:putative flippase GtrA
MNSIERMPEQQTDVLGTHAPRTARLLPQLVKFGAVGGLGLVVNFIVFNGLMVTVLSGVHHGPIYATVIATILAIITNWIGNRFWAFSGQRQSNTVREGVEFFLVSLAGMGIPLFCLWISHYVLGYDSLVADNIANYVVGLGLGMIFRFALYRWWVFSPDRAQRNREVQHTTGATASLAGTPDSGLIGDS